MRNNDQSGGGKPQNLLHIRNANARKRVAGGGPPGRVTTRTRVEKCTIPSWMTPVGAAAPESKRSVKTRSQPTVDEYRSTVGDMEKIDTKS